MTPKRDAAAVRRILASIKKHKAAIASLERDLPAHANRLSHAHGYCMVLRGEALERLAYAS